jgi:aspartate carbamoyltransferase catalytic subunit
MNKAFKKADVVYQTRVQKERHAENGTGSGQDKDFIIGKKELALMKKTAIIMHPLPRVNEIEAAVDKDPRAAYFRQAENGLYVRMALLDVLLDGNDN